MGQLSQKVGRNDPCPCQSGLKYKNAVVGIDAAGRKWVQWLLDALILERMVQEQ